MYELLYAAILGSVLYSVVNHVGQHFKCQDPYIVERLLIGSLFTAFFCASFLTTYNKENYGKLSFLIDIFEVFLMYLCFYYLGFFPQDEPPYSEPKIVYAHLTIIALLFTQLIWRDSVNLNVFELFELRLLFCYLLLFSMILGKGITPILCFVAFLCIGLYVCKPKWYDEFRSKFF